MRSISEIIIHCSATIETRNYTAADIDLWHRERGFKKIGYHFVVRRDGRIEQGRCLAEEGAHCLGHNRQSIGICYIGGLDLMMRPADTRTPAQRSALLNLLKDLKRRFPDATIYGHRDFANKECPCFDATEEYAHL